MINKEDLDFEPAVDGSEDYSEDEYYTKEQVRDRDRGHYYSSDEDQGISMSTMIELYTILCKDHGKAMSMDCSRCKAAVEVLGGPECCRSLGVNIPVNPIPEATAALEKVQNQPNKRITMTLP